MTKLTGTFYFKRTSNGNLMGEFTNDHSDEIKIETAYPTEQTTGFEGNYKSIWFDTKSQESELVIAKTGKRYKIEWKNTKEIQYAGEGFLVDNILIGYYR